MKKILIVLWKKMRIYLYFLWKIEINLCIYIFLENFIQLSDKKELERFFRKDESSDL